MVETRSRLATQAPRQAPNLEFDGEALIAWSRPVDYRAALTRSQTASPENSTGFVHSDGLCLAMPVVCARGYRMGVAFD